MRTILLISFFLFGITVSTQAQQKYEYAVVTYNTYTRTIIISIDNEESKKIQIDKNEVVNTSDALPVLKEINKMSNDSWDVYSSNGSETNQSHFTFYFFLRRKV